MMNAHQLLQQAERLLLKLEALLPPQPTLPDWSAPAQRWLREQGRGRFCAVTQVHAIAPDDLLGVEEQKARLMANTRQFVAGHPANNALLTGARGAGKSSLVKAVFNAHMAAGLRLVELNREALADLPQVMTALAERPERFILFCDDISFEANDSGYKALKSALDGSIAATPENVLIYATSNRRHLMPERMAENLEVERGRHGEIHPGETTEEKISLSERFGLWLSFYPIDQELYWAMCAHWLRHYQATPAEIVAAREEALLWALLRGGRSGRIAWHFARDFCGRRALLT